MRRFIRILLRTLGGLLLLLVTVVLILGLVDVKVDLSHLRGAVEISATRVLGREVIIAGPVELEFSNWPAMEVSGVTVANVSGAQQSEFFQAGLARMRLGIFPLLRGEINIAEITAEKVTLNLETDAQGNSNWIFEGRDPPTPRPTGGNDKKKDREPITFTAVDQLSLRNITVNYRNDVLNKTETFVLESMEGNAAANEPVTLELAGKLKDGIYDLKLEGGPLSALFGKHDKPWDFEIRGEVFGKEIVSRGDLVLHDHIPEINLALELHDLDVGRILSGLGLVEGMQASLGDVHMNVSINGAGLREILQQSSMSFAVRRGSWNVRLPNSEASFDIDRLSGDILVEKGNNLTMELDGVIDETPVRLLITGAPLVEYVTRQEEIPLAIDAEFSRTRLRFSSKVRLPLTNRDMTLALKMNSERIDHLNQLLRLELPPIGPVTLESKLGVTRSGYDLSTLMVQVGDSRLEGKLKLTTSQAKPTLDASLVSSLIQLDDFVTGQQMPPRLETPEAETGRNTGAPGKVPEERQGGNARDLLSYEVLSAFDANITVDARDVRSGKDRLGAALMQLGIEDARLSMEPLSMQIPGGGIQINMDYTPAPSGVAFNLKADVNEFELGVMARRAKPETDMGGKLTLLAELQSQAPGLDSVMEHAQGYIDFLLIPRNFSAGVIDLWAVNLLSAIMDKSTEKDESKINCVVVRLGIDEGLMEEKAIYLDTSNMRIAGNTEIDFKARELEISLAPKAKKPEFFNMAIPIKVKGSFEDFALKIGMLRMGSQVISFVTSPLHVPVRRIFTEEVRADGIEACRAAWSATGQEKGITEAASPVH